MNLISWIKCNIIVASVECPPIEWWVLCSAYFTIKYRYKKCQSLFLTDFFCYIQEINLALLFVVVWMLNFITRYLQRLLLRTVYLLAMDAQTCTVLGAKKCLRHLSRFSKTKLLKNDILHMTVINFIRLSWK